MARTRGSAKAKLAVADSSKVDEAIAVMAECRMCDVVSLVEGLRPRISVPGGDKTAAQLLVGRLFTDAVFNGDIRSIQLIINRIDGGLPKDTEVDGYQTLFGDCLQEVMSMRSSEQLKLYPEDTVMMSMCKSLFSMAVSDIYWDDERKRKRRPTDAEKKERDAALRMVLERTGGRRTLTSVTSDPEEVEVAPWIAQLQENTC